MLGSKLLKMFLLRFLSLTIAIPALACGPTIETPVEGGSTSSSDESSGPAVTTTPPPPPGTGTTTTPATSDTGTTAADTSDDSTDVDFIEVPDGGCIVSVDDPWHCTFECDPFVQDCPPDEKCVGWANDGGDTWNALRCSPVVDDPMAPGESCTMEGSAVSGLDDCDATSMCLVDDPAVLEGTCVSMCTGDSTNPVCPPSTGCANTNDGAIILCLPTCDPLLGDCEGNDACAPFHDDQFLCTPSWESAAAGVACETFTACAPGLSCQASEVVAPSCDPGIPGCCTPWCDLSDPDPAASCFDPAQECVPWFAEGGPPPGFDTLGVCALPA